jgi:hypothetical protein
MIDPDVPYLVWRWNEDVLFVPAGATETLDDGTVIDGPMLLYTGPMIEPVEDDRR